MKQSVSICATAMLLLSSAVYGQSVAPTSAQRKQGMIEPQWARNFAQEWIDAWNSHNLERILSHYTDDFEMASPLIIERMREPSGVLKGKAAIRTYWGPGLASKPPLRFELLEVFAGVRSITIYYRSIGRRDAAEVLEFNDRGEVVRATAHYTVAK